MTKKGGTVKFYLDHVLLKTAAASDAALEAAALQIEAQTKVNIQNNNQIDTGFMLNSTYVVTPRLSTYDETDPGGTQFDRFGHLVEREIAPQVSLPDNARAAVVVGAEYAVYQEDQKPFFYPAAETVAGQIKGTTEKIFQEHLND